MSWWVSWVLGRWCRWVLMGAGGCCGLHITTPTAPPPPPRPHLVPSLPTHRSTATAACGGGWPRLKGWRTAGWRGRESPPRLQRKLQAAAAACQPRMCGHACPHDSAVWTCTRVDCITPDPPPLNSSISSTRGCGRAVLVSVLSNAGMQGPPTPGARAGPCLYTCGHLHPPSPTLHALSLPAAAPPPPPPPSPPLRPPRSLGLPQLHVGDLAAQSDALKWLVSTYFSLSTITTAVYGEGGRAGGGWVEPCGTMKCTGWCPPTSPSPPSQPRSMVSEGLAPGYRVLPSFAVPGGLPPLRLVLCRRLQCACDCHARRARASCRHACPATAQEILQYRPFPGTPAPPPCPLRPWQATSSPPPPPSWWLRCCSTSSLSSGGRPLWC